MKTLANFLGFRECPACSGRPGDCPTADLRGPKCVHCDGELTRDEGENGPEYHCEPCDCPHDEHDHGVCLDCEKDISSDLAAEAEWHAELRADR